MPAAAERDERGASGLQETMEVAAMVAAGLGLGETALEHLPQDRPMSPAAEEATRELASQPHSSPASPEMAQEQDISPMPRRLSMVRSSTESPTAVPLHFRRPPSSPKLQRVVPTTSPTPMSPSSPNQPRHRRPNSTEFRNSREFRPLWLVERHGSAKAEPEPEEPLPSLPSSKSSSRAPSVEDLRSLNEQDDMRSWEPADLGDSIMDRRRLSGLAISIDTANQAHDAVDPDLLDSQQTTPTAMSFGEATAALSAKKEKPKYEFHSPSELLQDPSVLDELPPSPTLEALPSAEGSMVGTGTRDLAESEESSVGHKSFPGVDLGKAPGFGGLVDAAVLAAVKGREKPISPSHDKDSTELAALPKDSSPEARKIHDFGNIVDVAVMSKTARHNQEPTNEALGEPGTAIEEPLPTERELEPASVSFAEPAADEVGTTQSSKKKKKKKGKKSQASQSVDLTPSASVPVAEEPAPVVEELEPDSWDTETLPALANDKEETLASQAETEPTDTSRDLDSFALESEPTQAAEPIHVDELETAPEAALTTPVEPLEQPEDTAGLSKKAKREKKKQKKKAKSISLAEDSEDAPVSKEGEELQQEKGMEISPEDPRDEIIPEPAVHAAQDSVPSGEPALFEAVVPETREIDYAGAAFVEADSTPEPEQKSDDTISAPSLNDNTASTDKGDIETEEDDFHEAFEEQPFPVAETRELAPEASTDARTETPTELQEPLTEEAWETQPKRKGKKDKKKRKSVAFDDIDVPSEPTLAPEPKPEPTVEELELEKSVPAEPAEPSSTGAAEALADVDPTVTDLTSTSETAADEPAPISEQDSADRAVAEEVLPSTEPVDRSEEASRDVFEQPPPQEQPETEVEAEVQVEAPLTAAQKKKAKKEKQKKKKQQSVSSIPDEDKPTEPQPAEQLAEDVTSAVPDAEAEPTSSSKDIPPTVEDVSVEASLEEAKNEESLEPEQPKEDEAPSSNFPESAAEVAEADISSEQPQEPPTEPAESEDPPAEPEVFMTASQKKKAKKAKKKQQQQQQSISSITDSEKPDEAVSRPDTETTDTSKLPSTVDPEAEVPDSESAEPPQTSEDAAPATEIEIPTTADEQAAELPDLESAESPQTSEDAAPATEIEIPTTADEQTAEVPDLESAESPQTSDDAAPATEIETPTTAYERAAETAVAPHTSDKIAIPAEVSSEEQQNQPSVEINQQKDEESSATDASIAPAEPEPVQEEPETPPPEPAVPLTAAQKKKAKKEKKKQQQKRQSTQLDEQAAPEPKPASIDDNNAEMEPTTSAEAQPSLFDEAKVAEEMTATESTLVEADRELGLDEQSQNIINPAEEATPEAPVEESALDLVGASELGTDAQDPSKGKILTPVADYALASTETGQEDPADDTPTIKESTLDSSAEVMAPDDKVISDQPAEDAATPAEAEQDQSVEEVATASPEPSENAVSEQVEELQPVSFAKSKKQRKKDKKKRQSLSLDDEPQPAPVEEERSTGPASTEITEEPASIDKEESLTESEVANHLEEVVVSPQEDQQPEEPLTESGTQQDIAPEEPAAELGEADFQPAVSKKQRKKDKKKRKSVAWDDETTAAQFEQPPPEQDPSVAVENAQSEEAKAVEEPSDQQTEATAAESTEATELVADKEITEEVEPTLQEQEAKTEEAPPTFTKLTETAETLPEVASSEEPLQLATSPATESDIATSADATKDVEETEAESAPRVPTESNEQPEDAADSLTSPDQQLQTPDEAESQAASATEPKEEVALSAKERRKLKKKEKKKGKSVDLNAEEPAAPEPTQEQQDILDAQDDSLQTAKPEIVEASGLDAPAADDAKAVDAGADAEVEAPAEKNIGDEQPVVQEDSQPEQLETREIDTDAVADEEAAQPESEAAGTPEMSKTKETDVQPPAGETETVAEPEPSPPQITTEPEEEVGMSAKERRKAKKKDKKRRSKILDADDTTSDAPTDEPTPESVLTESTPADVTQDATEVSPLAEMDTMETSAPVTAPSPAEDDDGKEQQSCDIDTHDAPANDLASTDEFVFSQVEQLQPEGLPSDYYTQPVLERGVESKETEKDFVQEERGVESVVLEQESSTKIAEDSQDVEPEREGFEDKENVQDPVFEKEAEAGTAETSATVETVGANDPIEQDELSAGQTQEQFAGVNVEEAPAPAEEEAWQSNSSKKQKKKDKKKKQKQQVQVEEQIPPPEPELSAVNGKDQSEIPPSTDTEAEQTVPEVESESTLEDTPAEQAKDLNDEPVSQPSEAEPSEKMITFETPAVDSEGFEAASLSRKKSKKEEKKQREALLAQEADADLRAQEQPVAETPEVSVSNAEAAESQPTADETLEDQPVVGPADVAAETAEDVLKDTGEQPGDIAEQETAESAVVKDGLVDTPSAEAHTDEAEESLMPITRDTTADVPPAETAATEQTSDEPMVEPEEEWPAFTSKKSKKNKKKAAAAAAAAAAMAVEFATQDDNPVESMDEPTAVSGQPADNVAKQALEQEQSSKIPAEPRPEPVSKEFEDLAALSTGETNEEATINLEARKQEAPEQEPTPEQLSEETVPVELPTRKLSKKERQKAKKQAKRKPTDFTAFTEDPSDFPEPEPSEPAVAPTESIEQSAQEPAPGIELFTTETSTEVVPEPEPEHLEDDSAPTVEESAVIPKETQPQSAEEDQAFVSLDPFDTPHSPQAEGQDRAFETPEQSAIEETQDLQLTPEQQYEKDEEAESRLRGQVLEKAADLEVAEDMFEDRPREPKVPAPPSRKLSKKEKKKLKKRGATEDTPVQEYEEPPVDTPAELETAIPAPEPQVEQLESTDDAQPPARPESTMEPVDLEPTATVTEPVQDEWEVPLSRKASKKQAKKAKKAAQALEWELAADTEVNEPATTVPVQEEKDLIATEMEKAKETRADEDDWPTIEWEKGNVENSAQSPDQPPESEPVTLSQDAEIIGGFDEAAVPAAVKETEDGPDDGFMAEAWSMPLSKKDKKKAKKNKRKSQQQEAMEEEPEQTVAESIPEPAPGTTTPKDIELEAPAKSTAAKGSKLANLFPGLERSGFRRPLLATSSGPPSDDTLVETVADPEASREIEAPTAISESKDNIDIPGDELPSSGERELEYEPTTPTEQPTTATEEESPTDPDLPAFARSLAASSPPPAPQSATKERSSLLFSSSPSTRTEIDSASPRHSLPSQAHLAADDSHCGIRRTPSVIHGRHQHTPRTWSLEEAALQAERKPSPPRSLFGGPIDAERPRTPLDPIAEQDPADGGHATTGTRRTPRLEIKPEHVLPRPQTPVRQFTDTAHGRERWPTPEHEKKQKHKSPELQHPPELRPSGSNRSLRHTRSNGASRALDPQPPPDLDPDALPSSSSYDPVNDKGKRPLRTMTDVYGWGETPSSPRSPSRPPSVHRRRSMQHLQTLESRLDQLISENRLLIAARDEAEDRLRNASVARRKSDQALNTRGADLRDKEAEVEQLKTSVDWLQREMSRLTQENEGLTASNAALAAAHADEVNKVRESSTRELDDLRSQHNDLSSQMDDRVRQEIESALAQKDTELRRLREELEEARDKVKELQQQIAASLHDNALVFRDEDYFDAACQKLCGHVQQWVLRFSKHSDHRRCRTLAELNDEKIADRFDNALLDGSDADAYLSDRVRRRDIFMSVIMTMVWEYVFTRYLFGMDREQRQKLKSLEKQLVEVGPRRAVHRWRATTLTLLSRRPAFASQRENDTEAVVLEIFDTLARVLPPPSHAESQLLDSLRKVLRVAVNLSLEMRTQLAEFIMLPPLQPEYDTNGDLARQVYFNASLMNERSGQTTSNEDLENQQAVVRIVLFPLVVKKGNDVGEGDDEVVVCPAQVLVARPGKDKKVVRMLSGDRMSMDASKSVYSVAPSMMDTSNMI
ncbi:hypothetical protein N7510_008739 [Penicillium lagena]|uniref:uncharacterized protein n=1 Tax=Penicillium lagena TaxID=94218 RepID=UPI00253FD6C4|nr:uncharacterized protein N7510_008739 [Penicillium lagena]KAJ5605958.1 hypothetical protein N7510_008739 [Penicillium lagena]